MFLKLPDLDESRMSLLIHKVKQQWYFSYFTAKTYVAVPIRRDSEINKFYNLSTDK